MRCLYQDTVGIVEEMKDIGNAVKEVRKFVKNVVLTEVVPSEVKSRLKNYDLPDDEGRARAIVKVISGLSIPVVATGIPHFSKVLSLSKTLKL